MFKKKEAPNRDSFKNVSPVFIFWAWAEVQLNVLHRHGYVFLITGVIIKGGKNKSLFYRLPKVPAKKFHQINILFPVMEKGD